MTLTPPQDLYLACIIEEVGFAGTLVALRDFAEAEVARLAANAEEHALLTRVRRVATILDKASRATKREGDWPIDAIVATFSKRAIAAAADMGIDLTRES